MKIEYKVGDILLAEIPYLKECEIEKIAITAKCMKIEGTWYEASAISPKIKAVLGRAIYKKRLLGIKRIVQYV